MVSRVRTSESRYFHANSKNFTLKLPDKYYLCAYHSMKFQSYASQQQNWRIAEFSPDDRPYSTRRNLAKKIVPRPIRTRFKRPSFHRRFHEPNFFKDLFKRSTKLKSLFFSKFRNPGDSTQSLRISFSQRNVSPLQGQSTVKTTRQKH